MMFCRLSLVVLLAVAAAAQTDTSGSALVQAIQRSGDASAEQLAKDAKQIVADYTAAGLDMPKELLNAFDTLQQKGQEAADKLKESVGQEAHALGLQLGDEVAAGAQKAIDRITDLRASGEKNFGEMAGAVAQQINAIIASGQTLPPAYQQLFDAL